MNLKILGALVAVAAFAGVFALAGVLADALLVIGLVAAGACVVPWHRLLVHYAEDEEPVAARVPAPSPPADPWLT